MKTHMGNSAKRASESKSIWVFTPSRTDPADLEFILVQRQQLLKDAVERVRESALTGHKHHLLFVGPRGCGKTHLVTLIFSRLSEAGELADRLRIAWLNEDETCTTLLELLLKIHAALEKRYPSEYREEALKAAYDMTPEAATEYVSKFLLTALGARTLLVIAENLDAIFEGLGDSGQKKLRAYIQENPRFSIVATAQRLVENLSNRTSPFFGFFQIEHLKPLNVPEATELLQNIARLHNQTQVVEFLATSRGHSRVRALHHLSGGNHRIYIVLSQFITRDSIDALLGPFAKMVDELTPYYQERVRWLPAQQRKIVEYLCACETTVPVKEIAKRLFATPQSISSQLKDLREKGYVEASERGRESLYEISEPLMRICVEVKENQSHQPLRLLVDFLRVWYDDQELKRRLGNVDPVTSAWAYLESAIELNKERGSLRKQLFLEDLRLALPEQMNPSLKDGLISECVNAPEAMILATQSWAEGNWSEAFRCLDEAISEESNASDKTQLHLARAKFHELSGDRKKTIEDYTAVIELQGVPVDQIAMALFNRGAAFYRQKHKQNSLADFSAITLLADVPARTVVNAYLVLSMMHSSEGRWKEGFDALAAGIKCGAKARPPYLGNANGFIGLLFSAGLGPEARLDGVTKLFATYGSQQGQSVLGEGLVEHIGGVFRAGEPFPSADNLEQWASAWERAGADVEEFRLPLRLLRTGIEFVKAGGKDPGILLHLTSAERQIVRQALGLEEKSPDKPE